MPPAFMSLLPARPLVYWSASLGGAGVAAFVPAVVIASEAEAVGAPSPAGGRTEIVGVDAQTTALGIQTNLVRAA